MTTIIVHCSCISVKILTRFYSRIYLPTGFLAYYSFIHSCWNKVSECFFVNNRWSTAHKLKLYFSITEFLYEHTSKNDQGRLPSEHNVYTPRSAAVHRPQAEVGRYELCACVCVSIWRTSEWEGVQCDSGDTI